MQSRNRPTATVQVIGYVVLTTFVPIHSIYQTMLSDVPASEAAIMVTLQRRLRSGFDGDRERHFFRYVLQSVTASFGCEVDVEDWMITSYEVEFGPRIGSGGLCVADISKCLVGSLFICSGEVYKGVWNKAQVAIKVIRTGGLIPSPMVRRIDFAPDQIF